MEITLDEDGYRAFLERFRSADQTNAAGQGETQVDFNHGGQSATYFFKAPNFKCCAYSLNGGARINLTKYNHVAGVPSCSASDFRKALLAGGGGSTVVDQNLSKVIALTSEAARSSVVERNIVKALNFQGSFDFAKHELLFKNYGNTTDHMGYGGTGNGYLPNWEPLKKWHYASFFSSVSPNPKQQSAKVLKVIEL